MAYAYLFQKYEQCHWYEALWWHMVVMSPKKGDASTPLIRKKQAITKFHEEYEIYGFDKINLIQFINLA